LLWATLGYSPDFQPLGKMHAKAGAAARQLHHRFVLRRTQGGPASV